MCDPISMAGMALSAAGTASAARTQQNYVNQVNASNRQAFELSRKAREDERVRQQGFEREGQAVFDTAQAGLTRQNYDDTARASVQNFETLLAERPSVVTPDTRLPGQDGASVEVKDAIANRINKEAVDTRARIKAFSELVSMGRAGDTRNQNIGAAGDQLATLGGLRRGSLGVAQQEQDVTPAEVRPGSTTLADLLSGAGGILTAGGPGLFGNTGNSAIGAVRPRANPLR